MILPHVDNYCPTCTPAAHPGIQANRAWLMIPVVALDYELRMNFNPGLVDKVEKLLQSLEGDAE